MSIELQSGQWYRRKSGKLAYCIGSAVIDSKKMPEALRWAVQTESNSVVTSHFADDGSHSFGDPIVEHLPDCTGWDWQDRKSLGERLTESANTAYMGFWNCPWSESSKSEQGRRESTAEAFLRDVLKPRAGKSLHEVWLESRTPEDFLHTLTGLNFTTEATP